MRPAGNNVGIEVYVPSLANVLTSTTPWTVSLSVAATVACATTSTSRGSTPAAPTIDKLPPNRELTRASAEIIPCTGAR